jgi:hypothetical protein
MNFPKLKIGDRVVRGPDWKWYNQDGFEGNIGTIKSDRFAFGSCQDPDWVLVKWDNATLTKYYRYYAKYHDIVKIGRDPISYIYKENLKKSKKMFKSIDNMTIEL